ncbi:MAG: esterase/lipase family protein, partial [Nocardioides sp.]
MNKNPVASFLLPDEFRRPPLVRMLHEGRLVGEASRHAVRGLSGARTRTPYAGSAPARDADPVLLVPGFMAGDYTLAGLSRQLRREGHRTYRAGIPVANMGCTLDTAEMIESRLEAIVARREQRVQIVGHSLGGMLARGIAARRPDLVSGIVTMGSPVRARPGRDVQGRRQRRHERDLRRRRVRAGVVPGEPGPAALRRLVHRDLLPQRRHRRLARLPGPRRRPRRG